VLHGTQYRSGKFVHADEARGSAFAVATVPCPHLDRCALATTCAGEHYAVYSDLFGLDEFTPVTVDELYAMPPDPEADRVRRARPD
jgi:pyruvate/2-oxoacid:ferredoxin oxidoreductase beta subunit